MQPMELSHTFHPHPRMTERKAQVLYPSFHRAERGRRDSWTQIAALLQLPPTTWVSNSYILTGIMPQHFSHQSSDCINLPFLENATRLLNRISSLLWLPKKPPDFLSLTHIWWSNPLLLNCMLVELDCPYQSSSSTKLRFLQKDPRILSSEPILRWELVALVEAADLPEWKQAKFTWIFLPFTRSTSASKLEAKQTKGKLLYLPLSLSKRMKLMYLAVPAERGLT